MIYTNSDGGSRGNPGPGAIGVLVREGDTILIRSSKFLGERTTNNEAEYEALILALELASSISNEITCIMDSELVVKQLLGEYKVKNQRLLSLFRKVQKLQEDFKKIEYRYVSRENKYQKMVDELVNEELDRKGYKKSLRKN